MEKETEELSFAGIKEMFAKIAARQGKAGKQIKELSKRINATDYNIKEMRKRVEGIAERINNPYKSSNVAKEYVEELGFNSKISWDDPGHGADATNKYVRDLVNGVREDELRIREEPDLFFNDAFDKSMVFCGVKYDEMLLNLRYGYDWETKFDIVLINEDSVVIVEIMDENVPPDFIPKFAVKKIEQFREIFPEFKNLKTYLGIAAFSFRKTVLEKAKECGICAIRRVGNRMEMDVTNDSIEELGRRVDYISDRINNPYKSSKAAREYIKELELDRQISWDDPSGGVYATSKHSRAMMNSIKWDERMKIDSQAEHFFRDAFAKSMVFGGIKYDKINFHFIYNSDKPEMFLDIVLMNRTSIAIIEIRNGTSPGFIQKLTGERMNEFRSAFPKFKKRKIYFGIAGFLFSKRVLEKAKECGVGIIRREGDSMEMDAEELRAY
jgi:hypothetical protein